MTPTMTHNDYLIRVDFLSPDVLNAPGQIAMTNVPGKRPMSSKSIKKEDLKKDLANLRNHYNIDHLVCLLEPEELSILGIKNLLAQAQKTKLSVEQFGIPDDGLPSSMQQFAALVDSVITSIAAGNTVAIHCHGGKGRTGMLAACCLVQLGYSPDAAIALVRNIRPGTIEPAIKEDYVRHFAKYRNTVLSNKN